MSQLTPKEQELLHTLVELHEEHGQVTIHENMPEAESEALAWLVLKGMAEIRPTEKDQPVGQRIIVPTPVGREYVMAAPC